MTLNEGPMLLLKKITSLRGSIFHRSKQSPSHNSSAKRQGDCFPEKSGQAIPRKDVQSRTHVSSPD